MQNGLKKIDPYMTSYLPKLDTRFKSITLNNFIEVDLVLNLFVINENYEFDVIECNSFCENTGKWI
jgi:hypothetical protein